MRSLIRPALLGAARFGLFCSIVTWVVAQTYDVYASGEAMGNTFVYIVYRRATGMCLYTNEQFGWGGWIRSNRGIEYAEDSGDAPASETTGPRYENISGPGFQASLSPRDGQYTIEMKHWFFFSVNLVCCLLLQFHYRKKPGTGESDA